MSPVSPSYESESAPALLREAQHELFGQATVLLRLWVEDLGHEIRSFDMSDLFDHCVEFGVYN